MNDYRLPFRPYHRVIEFGGGESPIFRPNVDMRWLPTVDIVADLQEPLTMIESNAFDGAFARYVLEHLSWRKVRTFIGEVLRVLRPGGVAVFVTSNLLEQCRAAVEAERWDDRIISMLFGDQDYPENTHRCGFSPGYAVEVFREVGFSRVFTFPIETEMGPTDMVIEAHKSEAEIWRSPA